jgi:prophage maintenance system killer protein
MFLSLNGFRFLADQFDAGNAFFDAAAGHLDQDALVTWLSANSVAHGD